MLGTTIQRVREAYRKLAGRPPRHHERHPTGGSTLRELVFGANDGLVSNVALVAGVAGGTEDVSIIVLGGIAGAVSGAISMALGAYISTKSEREYRDSEEERERWEVEHMREEELAETRQILRQKGITGPLLDEVVAVVSRDHDQWVKFMMTEELGFSDEPPRPGLAAVVMGLAFIVAAFFPVAPFFFLDGPVAFVTSLAFTGVALFLVGAWRAYLTGGSVLKKAAEMVVLAAIAVAVANIIGRIVGVNLVD